MYLTLDINSRDRSAMGILVEGIRQRSGVAWIKEGAKRNSLYRSRVHDCKTAYIFWCRHLYPSHSNALLLFGIQVAEQDHKLRDARIQLEEYERKTKVQLEHRNLVSQQLEHTIVRGLHILLLYMNFGAKPTAACRPIRDYTSGHWT